MQINNYQNYHETKQHTTAEFPYNTYPCSIPLDFTRVPLHWHDELELIVIKKGHGLISVDFQKKIVNAGDIIFIRPGCLHSIEQHESDSHGIRKYPFYFPNFSSPGTMISVPRSFSVLLCQVLFL